MTAHEKIVGEVQPPFWPAAWKPLTVAVAVYLAIVVGYSAFYGFNPSCFLNVGYSFQWADEEHFAPGTVKYTGVAGYDACDYYLVALDPLCLKGDVAQSYRRTSPGINKLMRYQRVMYPLLTNLLACDRPEYFPYAMLAINLVSTIGMALVLMKLLMRRGASPWLSLIFVLGGGMLMGFWLDLQMHLFFFLTLSGLYYYETDRIALAALLFALALLTWESAVLFAGPIGLWELLHRRWRNAACFVLVLVPFLCIQAYFAGRMGVAMFSACPKVYDYPFAGVARSMLQLVQEGPKEGTIGFARKLMVVPVIGLLLVMLVTVGWKLWRGQRGLYTLMVLMQLLFFVIQDKRVVDTFTNAVRVNAGLVLPLVLSYRDEPDGVSPWIFAGVIGLAVLALVRIFSGVGQPYVLIGA